MPQELLRVPALYVVVGAYRLIHDPNIWRPIWNDSKQAIRKGAMVAGGLCLCSWPFTSIWVRFFMGNFTAYSDEASFLKISVKSFAVFSLLGSQASMILEFFLSQKLKKARANVYEATVASRGKGPEFWGGYVEEWEVPPIDRARKKMDKSKWYARLSGPLFRMLILKTLLLPLHFIPFLGIVVGAGIRALTLAEMLHAPFFTAKRMTPLEQAVYITENQVNYRVFGFCAALLERVPILGLVFSISNRIGAAMWAFDLEKRQYMFRTGAFRPSKRYESRTAYIETDVPDDAVGSFPRKQLPPDYQTSEAQQQRAVSEKTIRKAAEGGDLGLDGGKIEMPGTGAAAMSGSGGLRKRGT